MPICFVTLELMYSILLFTYCLNGDMVTDKQGHKLSCNKMKLYSPIYDCVLSVKSLFALLLDALKFLIVFAQLIIVTLVFP